MSRRISQHADTELAPILQRLRRADLMIDIFASVNSGKLKSFFLVVNLATNEKSNVINFQATFIAIVILNLDYKISQIPLFAAPNTTQQSSGVLCYTKY